MLVYAHFGIVSQPGRGLYPTIVGQGIHYTRLITPFQPQVDVHSSRTPFIYRKAGNDSGLRRELIIPFGFTGYVALYEIAQPGKVVVLAIRYQREEDY